MIIRKETPADYAAVYELVKAAFATSSNDGEWDYLNELRTKPEFLPELSLVAEDETVIIGQIVLYEMQIHTKNGPITQLVLSPISVLPSHFKKGVATALMREAFALAKDRGYGAVFLCGDPAFYTRFGFRPTHEFGIVHQSDESGNAPWCMVLELIQGALSGITGSVDIL